MFVGECRGGVRDATRDRAPHRGHGQTGQDHLRSKVNKTFTNLPSNVKFFKYYIKHKRPEQQSIVV